VDAPAHQLARLVFGAGLHLILLLVLLSSASWLTPKNTETTVAKRTATPVETPKPASATEPELPPPETERRDDLDADLPHAETARAFGFQFDVRKIRARWNRLFPFVTAPPSFESVARVQLAARRLVFADPRAMAPAMPAAHPPLSMGDAALQRLMDRTWSRRERWSRFGALVPLISAYHPDDGRLPQVIREYVEQNALQPYAETTLPDPRRWALLGLAADHQDFLDFAGPWVRQHPQTRTATELLFLIEALARGSRETLVMLLQTNPMQQMVWTRAESPDAWALFVGLREHYRQQLRERGLGSIDLVQARYDEVRLQLLSTALRLTPNGYRASDARLLIGRIHWRSGNRSEAIRVWRDMIVTRDDRYAETSAEILRALGQAASTDAANVSRDPARIEAILDAEQQKWVAVQFDRLRRFGYGFSSY
jgi:hypothetical protein